MAKRKFGPKDYIQNGGFIFIHLGCLLVIWAGASWTAVALCALLYAARMFSITAFYHRYFAHRTYKTSRVFQFLMGVAGATCFQNGPLWWSAHHRHHHRHSDTEEDIHSPIARSLYWAHMGWILSKEYNSYDTESVRDLAKYPEIRWLQRYNVVPGILLGIGTFVLGEILAHTSPELGFNGLQGLTWGFFISTTLLYHATFTINSLMHKIGRRRFETDDESRNSLILALITFGEGWHNNHHRYHASERQGFYWWEIDLSHYGLVMLKWLGLVWDLKTPPKRIYEEAAGVRERTKTPGRLRQLQNDEEKGVDLTAAFSELDNSTLQGLPKQKEEELLEEV
ncbi:MAG: acyl-CoA desaturase [Candidatus Kapaibacterium sp.]